MKRLRLMLMLLALHAAACASASPRAERAYPDSYSDYEPSNSYADESVAGEAMQVTAMSATAYAPKRERAEPAPPPSMAQRHAAVSSTGAPANSPAQANVPATEPDNAPTRASLLIYSGGLVLAIYEVDQTQEKTVALVEEMGGYVSNRTSRAMTVRVPAARFREALDAIAELGDVLDKSWKAQDVTDEVRDLTIRLDNSVALRDRLAAMLEKATTIEEALKIEEQLERITLEIERIKGSLKSFEDRIAYSTIEITFQAKSTEVVPKQDFLLPFPWLNTLGLESLLRAPSLYR